MCSSIFGIPGFPEPYFIYKTVGFFVWIMEASNAHYVLGAQALMIFSQCLLVSKLLRKLAH